jgi:predicted MPP superfamily phosphohydrolase
MKRKEWIKIAGTAGLASAASPFSIWNQKDSTKNKNRVLRIAHMTDLHLDSGSRQEEWTRICIDHIQTLDDRPDMIFNGGDTINDALDRSEASVSEQWSIWNRVEQKIALPVVHLYWESRCLGSQRSQGRCAVCEGLGCKGTES